MKYDILFNALKDAVEPDLDKLCEDAEMSDAPLVCDELNDKMQRLINKKNKRIHIPFSIRQVACIAVTFVILFVCSVNVDAYKEKTFEFLPIVTPDGLIIYTYGVDNEGNPVDEYADGIEIQKYELTGLDDGYELTYYLEYPWSLSCTYEKGDSCISFKQTYYGGVGGMLRPLEISKKYWIKRSGREYYVEELNSEDANFVDLIWGIDNCVFSLSTTGLSFDEAMRLAESIIKK